MIVGIPIKFAVIHPHTMALTSLLSILIAAGATLRAEQVASSAGTPIPDKGKSYSITLHHTVVNVSVGTAAQGASLEIFYRPEFGPADTPIFESGTDDTPTSQFVSFGSGALNLKNTVENGELNFNVIPNISISTRRHPIQRASDLVFDSVTSLNSFAEVSNQHEIAHDSDVDSSVTLHGHLRHPKTGGQVPFTFTIISSPGVTNLKFDLQLQFSENQRHEKPHEATPYMDWISLSVGAGAGEEIYGLGLQYSRWNQRGLIIPLISSEQGVGRGESYNIEILPYDFLVLDD